MAKKKGGILVLLAALVGAITAIFFTTDEQGETKETVRGKVKALKARLKDVDEKQVAQKIFGEKSDEVLKMFRESKETVVTRLAKLKGTLDEIDKQKYLDIVTEVTEDLKHKSAVTSKQLAKLKDYLGDDYKKLTKTSVKKKG
jgi:uncharacterized protein (DUF3084 family)